MWGTEGGRWVVVIRSWGGLEHPGCQPGRELSGAGAIRAQGLVLLCLGTTLHVLLAHSSTGTCLATAAGGLAGLLMSADYWQHR